MVLRTTICGIVIGFSLFCSILHLLGIHLLTRTRSLRVNQQTYLIHLSILEIIISLNQSIFLGISIFITSNTGLYFETYEIFVMIQTCGNIFTWVGLLFLLTLDRFLEVWLNIKYEVYITAVFTKKLVSICYLVGFLCLLASLLVKFLTQWDPNVFMQKYAFRIMLSLMIVMFVSMYAYMYRKLRQPIKRKQTKRRLKKRKTLRLTAFIPFWIIITFFLFVCLPASVLNALFYESAINKFTSPYYPLVFLLLAVGNATDFLIYVFLIPAIRKKFIKLLCGCIIIEDRQNFSASPMSSPLSRRTMSSISFQPGVMRGQARSNDEHSSTTCNAASTTLTRSLSSDKGMYLSACNNHAFSLTSLDNLSLSPTSILHGNHPFSTGCRGLNS